MLKNMLLAGIGGFLGTISRFLCYQLFRWQETFPVTLAVNVTGSFLIGVIMAMSARHSGWGDNWKIFLATGICGGFTTFSAFSHENMLLLQQGRYLVMTGYILSSIFLGVMACMLGYKWIS